MRVCCPSSITSREGHQSSPQRSFSCTSNRLGELTKCQRYIFCWEREPKTTCEAAQGQEEQGVLLPRAPPRGLRTVLQRSPGGDKGRPESPSL